MKIYCKKPVGVEAVQWFKNGDHPEDACELVTPTPNSRTQFEPFLSEGKIVRYYCRPEPEHGGQTTCKNCGDIMHNHGWINTLEGGHIVCPGDWIIGSIKGEFYPCKPDIFEATYEFVGKQSETPAEGK